MQPRASRLQHISPLAVLALDIVLIYGAFVLAYWIRYELRLGPRIQDDIAFSAYQPLAILLLGVMVPTLMTKGAYRARFSTDIVDEVAVIFSAATITVATVVVVTFMLHQFVYSRGVIVYVWVLLIVILATGRAIYRGVQGYLHRKGWGVRRLIVVGASDVAKMIMQSVMSRPDLGYHLVGFVEHRDLPHVRDFGRFRALGKMSEIADLIDQTGVDEVIIALPSSAHEEMWSVIHLCEERGLALKLVPDLFEMSLSRVQVDDIAGIPLLDVQEKPLRRVERAIKRAVDIVVASALLVASTPLLLALAVLIRLETRGPALLTQERVGKDGRRFKCLKLRTMHNGAQEWQPALEALNETTGPIFKIRDDPRCTRVGRYIRRWSLDELPQVWNVVWGDMSLVGPRPPLPSEVAEYEPWHLRRLEVKPGMTGIWQVSGRANLGFDEMVLMDIYYVDNWSPILDIKVMIRTIVAVLARHGAY